MTKKDTLYRASDKPIKPFAFNQKVVDVFPDMINRSVPGYQLTLAMAKVIAQQFVTEHSTVYDLGCSLGAVSIAISEQVAKEYNIIAVDNSEAMINTCLKQTDSKKITFSCEDICDTTITDASLVIMNFSLQFIPVTKRLALIEKIYAGLLPGGALMLSEKIVFDDDFDNHMMQQLHEEMKRQNDYQTLEIAGKRQALDKVLLPETASTHQLRLKKAGFDKCLTWLQCFNFISFLAIKSVPSR